MNFLGQKFGGGKPSGVGLGGFTELLCSSLIYTQTRRMGAHAHTDMCLSTRACTLTYITAHIRAHRTHAQMHTHTHTHRPSSREASLTASGSIFLSAWTPFQTIPYSGTLCKPVFQTDELISLSQRHGARRHWGEAGRDREENLFKGQPTCGLPWWSSG